MTTFPSAALSSTKMSKRAATECFYRGGLYNYFEGGAHSSLLASRRHYTSMTDGEACIGAGRYCKRSAELDFWYPCREDLAPMPPSHNRRRQSGGGGST